MREIKFRVWDEGNNVLHNDVEFIRSGIEKNDWIIFKSDKQKLEDRKVLENFYLVEQIKIMQFIGLKDKNGKEIYEGDIVKAHYFWFNGSEQDGELRGEVKYKDGSFFINDKEHASLFTDTSHFEDPCIEVIGNIYENPELVGEARG